MNEAKLSAGKNLKIHRLIGVLLGMCMLPKRQIYFKSNFWFHNFEQLCQLVYLSYNRKKNPLLTVIQRHMHKLNF